MSEVNLMNLVFLPVGLGMLGFLEPCSMGSNLLFIKYLEGKAAVRKFAQTGVFMLTRGLFIGALGALAALVGSTFVTAQKGFWILLGSIYLALGVLYLAGRAGFLMRTLGPGVRRLSGARGPVALGVLFGLNVPACAAPLLFALFGTAAVGGATVAQGFLSLALFGLVLSAPLALAVRWPPGERLLDRVAGLSGRIPRWTGALLVLFGLWSIYFGLFVRLEDWV
ncbi:MAG: cytochrome c biogenesis CcdA family protein [Alphaproteobacteria bacterium]